MNSLKAVLIGILLGSLSLYSQQPSGPGQLVDVFGGESQVRITTRLYRDASGNVQYTCVASARQALYTWTQASKAITDITDAANTATITFGAAHGLAVNNSITISLVTTDVDLNGTYLVQTVPGDTTVTVTTANVADATYTDATQQVTTTAPRTTAPIWSIRKITYSGNDPDLIQTSLPKSICSNKAVSTGATKVSYE